LTESEKPSPRQALSVILIHYAMMTIVLTPAEFGELQRQKLFCLFMPLNAMVHSGEKVRIARPISCAHLPGKDYITAEVIDVSSGLYVTDDECGCMVMLDNIDI